MKISIITAVFNRADTLGDALASLRSQRDCRYEHIVVDGGSSDGSLAIIERHADTIDKVVSEPDHGIYDALNKGLALATGGVVGVLHSDDVFADERVLARVAATFDGSSADGVYGDLDYVSKGDTGRVVRRWRAGDYSRARLRRGWMPPHPALFLRREVVDRFGAYDPAYQIAGDYDAMLRYLWRGDIRLQYLPEVLVRMRLGGASNRSPRRILRKMYEDYRALRANGVGGLGVLAMKNLGKLPQFFR
ncbi:MAG: glycosyltransferase family 2 protein [Gammaproteobacteria bacterium]|nr:glycosyltransferase family 2 protein [Gammaproteobacteria bacterium]